MALKETQLVISEVLDVNIGPQPHVESQVPAVVIRVVINHNLVAVPQPVIAVVVVSGSNIEIEAIEPKAVATATAQVPNVAAANSAGKVPVFPGMIEVVAGVVSTGIVPDLFAIVVNVWSLRMPRRVGIMVLLRSGRGMSFTPRSRWRGPSLRRTMGNRIAPVVSTFAPLMLGPGGKRQPQQYHKNSTKLFHMCLLPAFQCKASRVS